MIGPASEPILFCPFTLLLAPAQKAFREPQKIRRQPDNRLIRPSAAPRCALSPPAALAIDRPVGHQPATLLPHIATAVGRLNLVRDGVRQRHLGCLVRIAGLLGAPILEGRPETVSCQVLAEAHALEELQHSHVGQRLPVGVGKQVFSALGPLVEDLQRAVG